MDDYNAMPIAPEADYYTPEQRIGGYDHERPWETCMTLGTQWSWKPEDQIKSAAECIRILARLRRRRRQPAARTSARCPPARSSRARSRCSEDIGTWLEQNGESIYGTRGGPFKPTETIASTRKGSSIYIHLLKPEIRSITLPPLPARIVD